MDEIDFHLGKVSHGKRKYSKSDIMINVVETITIYEMKNTYSVQRNPNIGRLSTQ